MVLGLARSHRSLVRILDRSMSHFQSFLNQSGKGIEVGEGVWDGRHESFFTMFFFLLIPRIGRGFDDVMQDSKMK